MHKFLSSFFILLIINSATAQDTCRKITFQRVYQISRYNGAYEVMQTKDSGFLVTGTQSDELVGNGDGLLLKTNKYGEMQWVNAHNRTDDEYPFIDGDYPFFSSAQLADSSYLSVAHLAGVEAGLQKTDKTGSLIWQKKFGRPTWNVSFDKVVSTPDNAVIVTGYMLNSFFPENGGSLILKIDEDGNIVWQKMVSNGLTNYPISPFIKEDTILVQGVLPSSYQPAPDSAYILKMSLVDGQVYQSKKLWLDGYQSIGIQNLIKRSDDNYVLTISYNEIFSEAIHNMILSIDQNFDVIQATKLISIEAGAPSNTSPSYDNGFVMLYESYNTPISYFIKFDHALVPQFGKFYSPLYRDDAFYFLGTIKPTNDSGYVMAGGKYFADSSLFFVFKTDALGNTGDCPSTNIPTPAVESMGINNEAFVWETVIDPGLVHEPLDVPASTPNYFDSTLCSNSTCDRPCTIYAPNGKIYLCHVPPGNTGSPEQLILPLSAVNHHLSNHPEDRVGLCGHPCSNFTLESNNLSNNANESANNSFRQAIIYPNPTTSSFTVRFGQTPLTPVVLTVFSADGKIVYKASSQATREINFGDNLATGIYFVEVKTNSKKEVFKIIKLR